MFSRTQTNNKQKQITSKQQTNNKKAPLLPAGLLYGRRLTFGRVTRAFLGGTDKLRAARLWITGDPLSRSATMSAAGVMTMRYPNGRMIYNYQSCSAVTVASLLLLLMAATTATSKPCLTKEEAKKLWPNEWLYWHTERHCWDHIKGTSGTYDEQEPTQQAANVVPAPPPKQVMTTKLREPEILYPTILYPTMVFNKANILEMIPLTMHQPWLSRQSISNWPLLIDVDRPSFRQWDKRIGAE